MSDSDIKTDNNLPVCDLGTRTLSDDPHLNKLINHSKNLLLLCQQIDRHPTVKTSDDFVRRIESLRKNKHFHTNGIELAKFANEIGKNFEAVMHCKEEESAGYFIDTAVRQLDILETVMHQYLNNAKQAATPSTNPQRKVSEIDNDIERVTARIERGYEYVKTIQAGNSEQLAKANSGISQLQEQRKKLLRKRQILASK